jgi:hypothetical protein
MSTAGMVAIYGAAALFMRTVNRYRLSRMFYKSQVAQQMDSSHRVAANRAVLPMLLSEARTADVVSFSSFSSFPSLPSFNVPSFLPSASLP